MKRFEFQINCLRVVVTQNRRVGNIEYDLITVVFVIWQNRFYTKETNSAIFFLIQQMYISLLCNLNYQPFSKFNHISQS